MLVKATQNSKAQIENQSTHSSRMNNSFTVLKTAMENLREKTQLQQIEDASLEQAMQNLHLVNSKNSEDVQDLRRAVQI